MPETVIVTGDAAEVVEVGYAQPAGAGGGGGTPSGAAGGDLGSFYPNPAVTDTHLSAPLPLAQGGTAAASAGAALASLGAASASALAAETSRAQAAEALAAQKSANLSDLGSAAAARTNLGLGTAALLSTPVPAASLPGAGDWLNVVTQYGADPAGVVAADTAIQNAISAASAAGGGVVWLPKGNYKLTSGLTVASGVTIRGAGALRSVLRPASGVTAITAAGSSGSQVTQCVYEDFGIAGPGQGTGSAPGMSLTWCTTGTRLSRLYILTTGSHGIVASNSYTVTLSGLILANCGGDGLHAASNVNSWLAQSCTALLCTGSGYHVDGGAAGTFLNCDAESNGDSGYQLLGTFSFTVDGAECENNGSGGGQQSGIYLGRGSAPYGLAQNTVIRGCWLQGTSVARYGVTADGANLTVIESCGFQNNLTANIQVTANATNTIIRPNNYIGTVPSGGNITDTGTATQNLDYDAANSVIRSSGLSFGPAGSAADVTLTRAASGRLLISGGSSVGQVLKVSGTTAAPAVPNFYVASSGSTDLAVGTVYSGAGFLPWQMTAAGRQSWGSGSAGTDTTLARAGTGILQAGNSLSVIGLAGATAATKYAGGTATGAPVSGTFATGDWTVAQDGYVWVCTAGGSPGTWKRTSLLLDGAAADIQPAGAQAAGSTGLAADAGHVHPAAGAFSALDAGYLAWNFDPLATAVNVSTAMPNFAAGVQFFSRIDVRSPVTPASMHFYWVQPTGGSPANCYVAFFRQDGTTATQVAVTGDLAGAASGFRTLSLGLSSPLPPGWYAGACLIGAQGSTQAGGCMVASGASLSASSAFATSNGLLTPATGYRAASQGTGLSAMPSSVTLAGNVAAIPYFWVALK